MIRANFGAPKDKSRGKVGEPDRHVCLQMSFLYDSKQGKKSQQVPTSTHIAKKLEESRFPTTSLPRRDRARKTCKSSRRSQERPKEGGASPGSESKTLALITYITLSINWRAKDLKPNRVAIY